MIPKKIKHTSAIYLLSLISLIHFAYASALSEISEIGLLVTGERSTGKGLGLTALEICGGEVSASKKSVAVMIFY